MLLRANFWKFWVAPRTVGCMECEQLEPLKGRGHRSWSQPVETVKW